jgi:hypothetical protein
MITGTVLAIFMVPVFFVAVMGFFSRGTPPRPPAVETSGEPPPARQLAEGQDARS